MDDVQGKITFDKITYPPAYVYDPDPLTTDHNVWDAPEFGYTHMRFQPPASARRFFQNAIDGFIFSYFNKTLSPTFSEVVGVYGSKKNIPDKEEFIKFATKLKNNLIKSSSKSATIESVTEDSLTCKSDYIYSVYFVEKDSKPKAGKWPDTGS